jgi:transcriptional regulator with XRE-family HTH domain
MNLREVGSIIKKRRQSLGIDQKDLSRLCGVAVHTVSNVEAGEGNPTVKTLSHIAEVLGMEIRIGVKE